MNSMTSGSALSRANALKSVSRQGLRIRREVVRLIVLLKAFGRPVLSDT